MNRASYSTPAGRKRVNRFLQHISAGIALKLNYNRVDAKMCVTSKNHTEFNGQCLHRHWERRSILKRFSSAFYETILITRPFFFHKS